MTNKEKFKKLNELFYEFKFKMLGLAKRQTKLLEKVKNLVDAKKLKEIREKIEKMNF